MNTRNSLGVAPLHNACSFVNYNMIDTLLDIGADINIKDNDNNTALHLAVYSSDTNIIKKLLIRGADKHLSNNNSLTPYQLSININKIEISEILKTKNCKEKYFYFEEELVGLKQTRYDIALLSFFGMITLIIFIFCIGTMSELESVKINELFECFSEECVFENCFTVILMVYNLAFYTKMLINMYSSCKRIYEPKGVENTSLIVLLF